MQSLEDDYIEQLIFRLKVTKIINHSCLIKQKFSLLDFYSFIKVHPVGGAELHGAILGPLVPQRLLQPVGLHHVKLILGPLQSQDVLQPLLRLILGAKVGEQEGMEDAVGGEEDILRGRDAVDLLQQRQGKVLLARVQFRLDSLFDIRADVVLGQALAAHDFRDGQAYQGHQQWGIPQETHFYNVIRSGKGQ